MDKKRCFECKKIKRLDNFSLNTRKYQLKADMGRCIVCHTCTKARALRDMKLIILNSETQKFETLYFTSKNQVLKHIRELKLNKMEKLSFGDENPALNKGAVMPRYFYQDGSEVKENDIVFYSEDGGDHKYHYADSIGIIVKRENDFKMKAYVITMTDAKSFEDYEEPEHNMVSLKYGCENYYPWNKNLPNTLQHFTKIGEYPKDENMLSAEFAMESYVYNGA